MSEYIILSSVDVGQVPKRIVLSTRGIVSSQKGEFIVDELAFKEMRNTFKNRKIDLVVDYEHQTLENVQAPAAGWIKEIYLTSKGIEADVEWTPRAKEYLKNKEYRYLSPVIYKRQSDGRAIILHSVALTNTPAINGIVPLVNSLDKINLESENKAMELKELAVLLGLEESASLEQILEVVKSLSEDNDNVSDEKIEEAHKIKYGSELQRYKAEVDRLNYEKYKTNVDDFIKEKMQQGVITPAMKEAATEMALKDLQSFSNYIAKCPVIIPYGEIKYLKDTKPRNNNNIFGLSDEDYRKYGNK